MTRIDHPGVRRMKPFADTFFATMTARANEFDAINLGQGFPDWDGPQRMLEIAQEQIARGNNQYAPARGFPSLREAISRQRSRRYGQTYDPATEILVTVGATEALAASVLGLVEPGNDVIVFEPYYDAYVADIAIADANRLTVPLVPDGDTWAIDTTAFEDAITDKTALVIVNTPHNPTGAVLDLTEFSRICVEHDLIVISDEAYEYLTFDGIEHKPTASYPGMRDRTITIGSAAKTFAVTGWKTGWALAPAPLIDAIARVKQFMSFVGMSAVQPAVAYALDNEESVITEQTRMLQTNRDMLSTTLLDAGLNPHSSNGTYFLIADAHTDATNFCMDLPRTHGIAAVPVSAFTDAIEPWNTQVRFSFAKSPAVIEKAARRLSKGF